LDSIGDYYWYGDKEKVIEPARLPNIDLTDREISSYLNKIEIPFATLEAQKKQASIPKNNYESEFESFNAMDVAINRELIPSIFFEDGFSLGDVSTFQKIFSEEAMTASLLLQEKVS